MLASVTHPRERGSPGAEAGSGPIRPWLVRDYVIRVRHLRHEAYWARLEAKASLPPTTAGFPKPARRLPRPTEIPMRTTKLFPLALVAIAAACATDAVAPPTDPGQFAPTFAASADGIWSIADTGETGPGSRYAIFVPKAWNGTTIFYAHGFNDVTDPVA